MSFNINNTNFQCAPMYNRNKNNQVMGYLCSSGSRNVEGFDNGELFDKLNRNTVRDKDGEGNHWKYLGEVSINSSDQDGSNSKLYLNVSNPSLDTILKGLNNMKRKESLNENSLPLIFLFHKGGKSYVMRTTNFEQNGNQLLIQASRSKGIHDEDFKVLKQIGSGIELRVGIASTEDNSQRGGIDSIFNN